MRRFLFPLLIVTLLGACASRRAGAQDVGQRNQQDIVMNAVNAPVITPVGTGAQACPAPIGFSCQVANIGVNAHFLTYTVSGGTAIVQIRLEGSFDGSTFFAISDDATNQVSGGLYASGVYAAVRANLVVFIVTSGAPTLKAGYSGVAGSTGVPTGVFNPSPLPFKILANTQATGASFTSAAFNTPFGSTGGYVWFTTTGNLAATNCTLVINAKTGNASQIQAAVFTLPQAGATNSLYLIPNLPASQIAITFNSCGASATTFSAAYFFQSPVLATAYPIQPPITQNSQTVSAAATAINLQLVASVAGGRVHLYQLSAFCSAGTATLFVDDGISGGTTIWTTPAGAIGTSKVTFSWSPGLASSVIGSTSGLRVNLSTCGGGNTGTLDVQASQY